MTAMNRRTFIRHGSAAACLWSLPVQALLASSRVPAGRVQGYGREFSLAKLDDALKNYDYPRAGGFDPASYKWRFQAVSALSGRGVGSVDLSRGEEGDTVKYRFDVRREIPGKFLYRVEGAVDATNGDFPAVRRWECRSMVSRSDSDEPWHNTRRSFQGEARAGQVTFTEGGKTRVEPIASEHLSWKWGVIDLVRAMAAKNHRHRVFSTLDEMDLLFGRQEIRFRTNMALTVGEGAPQKVNFQVFDLQGDGVIPTVYWVDAWGRVVFVVTGTEGYLLMPGA